MREQVQESIALVLAVIAALLMAVVIYDVALSAPTMPAQQHCVALARPNPYIHVMRLDAPGGEPVAILHDGQPALVVGVAVDAGIIWLRVLVPGGPASPDQYVNAGLVNLHGGCAFGLAR